MHPEVQIFCLEVKMKFPSWPHPSPFHQARVLDVGSLDINGSNRYLFTECGYTGIDIVKGYNVEFVTSAHEFDPLTKNYLSETFGVAELATDPQNQEPFDTVISTEMLEHDCHWKESLRNMYRLLRPGGLLIITCATGVRPEHGTTNHCPADSPLTNDWYKNLSPHDIVEAYLPVSLNREIEIKDTIPELIGLFDSEFSQWEFRIARDNRDLYFWGVKADA